jgi:ApaG protein
VERSIQSLIQIGAVPIFRGRQQTPFGSQYFFSYTIKISNLSNSSIHLLSRKWMIFDSDKKTYIVEGEGVIGQKPILHPGESFEYSSGVGISGFAGAMKGIYFFEKIDDQTKFTAEIPLFQLTTDFSLN